MKRSTAETMVDLEAALERLAAGTRELTWDWDRRSSTAVGRVSAPEHLAVLTLLDDTFASCWDHQSIGAAPDVTRTIADGWGGLRPGQRLYTFDPDDAPLLFAAWWPWGSGTTFSVRFGCYLPPGADTQPAVDARVRAVFGA